MVVTMRRPLTRLPENIAARVKNAALIAIFTLYTAAALAWLLIGLVPALATAFPPLHDLLHRWGVGEGLPAALAEHSGIRAFAWEAAVVSHTAERPGNAALQYLWSIVNLVLGISLIRMRLGQRDARLLAFGLVGTAAVFNLQAHAAERLLPSLAGPLHNLFHLVAGTTYVFALVLFPDGQVVPRWSQLRWWLWPVRAAYWAFLGFVGVVVADAVHLGGAGFLVAYGILIPMAGVSSQAARYRYARSAYERQRSKVLLWLLVVAFVVSAVIGALIFRPLWFNPYLSQQVITRMERIAFLIFPPLFTVIPVMLFAIMVRYRVWDVDRLINRTLVYAALTTILAFGYFGSVVVFQQIFRAPIRQQSDLAIVVATLVLAALFAPLRRRVQTLIDRLFYRERYDAARTLQAFSSHLSEKVDLNVLADDLLEVVQETMQPVHVSLWLRTPESHRAGPES